MNFLVKATAIAPTKKGEKHKAQEFNLLTNAITYTDAEASATSFFEKVLNPLKYTDFRVSKIGTESFNLSLDTLTEDDDADFSTVFKAKVSFGYDEEKKKQSSVVIVRANSIEEAGERAREYVLEYRKAAFATLSEIKETVISPNSPIFKQI